VTSALVPQRAVIVVPTTAEFDSRTFRVASALVARGHTVTVLARADGRLPRDETTPAGYRIVRVPVSSIDGLPLPAGVRRWLAKRRRASQPGGVGSGGPSGEPERSPASAGRLRRAFNGATRLTAIALTVRSQERRSRAVDPGADVYHAMAYMGIPVGLDLARRSGGHAVYDARDIYTDAHNMAKLPGPARRAFGRIERRWARRSAAVVTVNRPYAEVMAAKWDLPLPTIVLNCTSLAAVPASDARSRRFHERLGLDPDVAVVLYQGGFSRERGIEQLVTAIRDVPGAVLVLMGYGVLRGELDAIAADPASGGRIHVLDAVPPAELIGWVAAAEVVAMPIQPSTLNHRLTTPNKLFEAMAAGVPVVASDLPGMAPIVRETGCGLVCDPSDPAAIAMALRAILDAPAEERAAYRERALDAVRSTYNWEAQMTHLLAVYERLTGKPW
jgi:glycosyltransferase involved in cell wall biosynthesis